MEHYTLVVVDMQPDFPAATDVRTIAAVARQVKLARENHCAVVFLEVSYLSRFDMEEFKPTHRELINLVRGYDRYSIAEKLYSDGSWAVQDSCKRRDFAVHHLRVCGVNTDVCVQQTVSGLAKSLPNSQIDVVQDACNTSTPDLDWNKFTSLSNVNLLVS
jgi:nicotinamidase-related amidase